MYIQYGKYLGGEYIPTRLRKRNRDNPRKSFLRQLSISRYLYKKRLQILQKGGNLKNTNSRVW